MEEFPDRNQDGVPDAFEHRRSIAEELDFEKPIADDSNGTRGECSDGVHFFDERPWVRSDRCKCGYLRRTQMPIGT